MKDNLLLGKFSQDVPKFLPITFTYEKNFGIVLHGDKPAQGTRRIILIPLCEAKNIPFNCFFYNIWLHQIMITVSTDFNRACSYDSNPVVQKDDLVFAIELDLSTPENSIVLLLTDLRLKGFVAFEKGLRI